MSNRAGRCKNILFVAALGVGLLTSGVTLTKAADRDRDCDRRIQKAEEQLRKAVDRHGEHSPQAEKKRHDLEETRRSCGDEHHEH
jgi:Flp pilus assembly protein TadB